jgi:hypothetical protein
MTTNSIKVMGKAIVINPKNTKHARTIPTIIAITLQITGKNMKDKMTIKTIPNKAKMLFNM